MIAKAPPPKTGLFLRPHPGALVDRPGRVDLALEVPRTDAMARERLLRLYSREVPLDDDAVAATVAAPRV